jgi:Cu/Ag efflux protein CusF
MSLKKSLSAVVLAVAMPLAANAQPAAAPAPVRGPVTAVNAVTLTAVVEKLDLATRHVTLRGESGTVYDFVVSPEFTNLDKVRVGDTVAVNYTQAIAARLATVAEAGQGATIAASGTPPGTGRPVSVSTEVTERLKVVAIDRDHSTVTLTGPGGQTETVEVLEPALQARLKNLKVGDELFVTYSESLALSLVPTGKR